MKNFLLCLLIISICTTMLVFSSCKNSESEFLSSTNFESEINNQNTPIPQINRAELTNGELIVLYTDGSSVNTGLVTPIHGTDGFDYYLLPDDTYAIIPVDAENIEEVTIPSVYCEKAVTIILNRAFFNATKLKSIIISDNITGISDEAFSGCSSLESIIIPNGVTYIGWYTFYNCSSLAEVSLPDSLTFINSGAFRNCISLKSITIPKNVHGGGDAFLAGCTSLTNISVDADNQSYTSIDGNLYSNDHRDYNQHNSTGTTLIQYAIGKTDATFTIPDGVTCIGWSAFSGCSSLESITIPDSVTSISVSAFYDCSRLESITIPDSVTSIGDTAFSGCSSLESITIPDSVTSIGRLAFTNCCSLTSITIPDSITSISPQAFDNCSSLTSITIPDSITSIENGAFYGCSSLTSIKYRGTQSQWSEISKGYTWNSYTGDYTITYNYTGE